jgi:hypothetical protein
LGNVHEMPVVDASYEDDHLKQIIQYYSLNPEEMEKRTAITCEKIAGSGKK